MRMEEESSHPTIVPSELREELEKKEIEAPNCRPSNDIYARLLAVYLYENDLCSAKFLWKRIPEQARTDCSDLIRIWDVGKEMWKGNNHNVFGLIDAHNWSDDVALIIQGV